jgi:hypothetical protein
VLREPGSRKEVPHDDHDGSPGDRPGDADDGRHPPPDGAEASNRFAVVGLENGTHVTIRVQHKWGDGQWKEDVVPPGGRKWFWWTYAHANDNTSPKFHVKFDSDLHPGKIFTINYDLKKNAAPAHEWENARQYVFKYDGTRDYIDLYAKS